MDYFNQMGQAKEKLPQIKSKSNIFIGDYPFHEELKEEMVSLLEDYPDCQNNETNVKGTMTEWSMDMLYSSWNNVHKLDRLKDTILKESYRFYGSNHYPENLKFTSFWGNIYRKGDYTTSHDHLFTHLGCVYFLKSEWYYSPLVFSDYGQRIRPKEGRYVIFPSHLFHHVPKHRFKETRITLSGNIFDDSGKLTG